MNIGKGQGEFALATTLIQTVEKTFHPKVPGLAKIYKPGLGADKALGTDHAADNLFNPLTLLFSHNSHHHHLDRVTASSNPDRKILGQF